MQSNLRGELTVDHGERREWENLGARGAGAESQIRASTRPPEQMLMRAGSMQDVFERKRAIEPAQSPLRQWCSLM